VPPETLDELVESVRARVLELDAELRGLTALHETSLDAVRREAEEEADRRIAAIPPAPPAADLSARILDAFSRIEAAASASDMLGAIASAASEWVAGSVLLMGTTLEPWPPAGNDGGSARPVAQDAVASGRVVRRDGAIAIPLLLDGDAVAVLCASSVESDREAQTLEGIARYGAAQLAALTAVRTARAQHWIRANPTIAPSSESNGTESASEGEDAQAARRYARLLVSEIKLYNERAVDEGRAQRDLSNRLGAEIDRARRLYEERVPSRLAERGRYFQHELIQTLAGGDATLFG
jgi:hypothetical protein